MVASSATAAAFPAASGPSMSSVAAKRIGGAVAAKAPAKVEKKSLSPKAAKGNPFALAAQKKLDAKKVPGKKVLTKK